MTAREGEVCHRRFFPQLAPPQKQYNTKFCIFGSLLVNVAPPPPFPWRTFLPQCLHKIFWCAAIFKGIRDKICILNFTSYVVSCRFSFYFQTFEIIGPNVGHRPKWEENKKKRKKRFTNLLIVVSNMHSKSTTRTTALPLTRLWLCIVTQKLTQCYVVSKWF